MTSTRALAALVCFCTVGLLTGLPNSAYAQRKVLPRATPQQKVLPRATPQQIDDFLKRDPTLSSGFETAHKEATVRVIKPVNGGVLLRYESARVNGTMTVVGPAVTTLDKDVLAREVCLTIGKITVKPAGVTTCTTTTTTTTTTSNGNTTTTTVTTTKCAPA